MQVIQPNQFKVLPWKNGKGTTTELAISPGGTLEHFDWRLSIATVSEDGPFSSFAGIERNLILIDGLGIKLTHDNEQVDLLNTCLDFATFDGGCATQGTLMHGPIKDFNLMHNPEIFSAQVITIKHSQTIVIQPHDLCFIYGLNTEFEIELDRGQNKAPLTKLIGAEHLTLLSRVDASSLKISGKQIIVIQLLRKI